MSKKKRKSKTGRLKSKWAICICNKDFIVQFVCAIYSNINKCSINDQKKSIIKVKHITALTKTSKINIKQTNLVDDKIKSKWAIWFYNK